MWLSLPARSGHNYSLMVALLDEYVQTLKEFPDDFGVHSIHRAKGDLYRVYFTEAQFANDFVEVFR